MTDYMIEIRVKNGPMRRAMRAAGIKTASELARRSGVYPTRVGEYLNLKFAPMGKDGAWRDDIQDIADVLGVEPDGLFPEKHLSKALACNKVELEASADALANYIGTQRTPEQELLLKGIPAQINRALETLRPREQAILAHRYGLNGVEAKTFEEVSLLLSVSHQRARQLEAKALRKLKHPGHRRLREAYEVVMEGSA